MLFAGHYYSTSGAVVASANNQIIEGLDIIAPAGTIAVDLNGKTGVTVRKNRIRHLEARGISIPAASTGASISDNDIIYNDFGRGPIGNENWQPIFCQANGTQILRNRIQNGNGIKIQAASSVLIQFLQCLNLRGTNTLQGFGGGISLDSCDSCSLLDGYIKSDLARAWTGDNINVSNITSGSAPFNVPGTFGNHTIARWLIDGNNAPPGAGVQLQQTSGCTVTDVDVINVNNQAFVTTQGIGNSFTRCRARDFYSPNTQGRGLSTAGGVGVAFATLDGPGACTGIVYSACNYFNLGIAGIHFKDSDCTETTLDLTSSNFTPQTPYTWVPVHV